MCSGTAPYATLSDLPRFEERGKVTSAPWMKEQAVPHNGRAHNHEPYITCNSQTAPFATFHNQPLPLEYTGSMLDAPWDKDQQQANQWQGSHREHIKSTPYATSDHRYQVYHNMCMPQSERRSTSAEPVLLSPSCTSPYATSSNSLMQKALSRASLSHDQIGLVISEPKGRKTLWGFVFWQPNKSKVQQAPWDRDELNDTKASSHQIPNAAPFATEPIDSSSEDPCQTTFT